MENDSEKIIQHYEAEFGKQVGANVIALKESSTTISILEFIAPEIDHSHVVLTHGVSKYGLQGKTGGVARQELMMYVKEEEYISDVKVAVAIITDMMLKDKLALGFGQVLNLKKPVIEGLTFEGFCAVTPMYQKYDFHVVKNAVSPIAIVCLYPLYKDEVIFIDRNGYEAFQKLIEENSPSLWSLERGRIPLV